MNVDHRFVNYVGMIILVAVTVLLFIDAFLDVSEVFTNGWFHFLLGVFLLGSGVFLFNNRSN
jgi:hypothetical protein